MPVKRKNILQKKVYGNLENEDDNDGKFLTCFICLVQDRWKDHLKKPEHQSKLKFFNESFVDISDVNVRCKVCKSLVPKAAFEKHASKKHQLIPWYRPENEFTTFFKNNITNIGDEYHCYLCDKTHNCWYESIRHTESTSHLQNLKKFTRLNDINTKELTEKTSQQFVTNRIIFLSHTQLRCWTCDCDIAGYDNAGKHIVSETHKSNLLKKKKLESETCNAVFKTVNTEEDQYTTYFENFIMKRHNDYYCNLCNKYLLFAIMDHIEDPKHKNSLSSKRRLHNIGRTPFKPNICELLVKNNIFEFDTRQLECYSCKFIISSYNNLENHLSSKNHKTNLGFVSTIKASLSPKNNDTANHWTQSPKSNENFPKNSDNVIQKIHDGYYCHLCNVQFSTYSEAMAHLDQQEHIDLGAAKGITQIIINQNPTSSNYCPEDHVICKLCNTSIPKDSIVEHAIKEHQSMPWHKPDNEFIVYFKNFITPKNNYYCYICNTANNGWYLALEHTKSVGHSDCVKIFINDDDINQEALKQCKKFVDNSIFPFTFTQLRCWKCNCVIDGYENAGKHINSDEHKKALKNITSSISASEVPDKISCDNSRGIILDSGNSVDDEESIVYEIKTDQPNLSDSLEKKVNINDSKGSNSSGYASVNAETAINNDSSDDHINSSPIQSTNDRYLSFNNSNNDFCAGAEHDTKNKDNDDYVEARDQLYKKVSSKNQMKNLPHEVITNNNQAEATHSQLSNTDLITNELKDLSISKIPDGVTSNENQDHVNIAIGVKQSYCVPDEKSLLELEDLYIEYFKNCIFTWNNRYYCNICQVHLSTEEMVTKHMKESFHENQLDLRRKYINFGDELPYIPNCFEKLVRNNIFHKNTSFLFCYSCQCSAGQYNNFEDHINNQNHLTFFTRIFTSFDASSVEKRDELVPPPLPNSEDHFKEFYENWIEKRRDSYCCHLCQVRLSSLSDVSVHINNKSHIDLKNSRKKKIKPIQCTLYFYELCVRNAVFQKFTDQLQCFVCDGGTITMKHFDVHIANKKHKRKYSTSFLKLNNPLESDIIGNSEPKVANTVEHKTVESSESIIANQVTESNSKPTILNFSDEPAPSESKDLIRKYFTNYIYFRTDDYFCNLCNLTLSPLQVTEHLEHPDHKILVKEKREENNITDMPDCTSDVVEQLIKNNIFQVDSTSLHCFTCGCPVQSACSFEEHIDSDEHYGNLIRSILKNSESTYFSNHIATTESENDYHQYFENFIMKDHSDYFCHVCYKSMASSFLVNIHMEDEIHKSKVIEKKQSMNIMVDVPFERNIYQKLVRNNIFPNDSQNMKCYSCHWRLTSFMDVELHIQSKEHLQIHGFVVIESPGERTLLTDDPYQSVSRSSRSSTESISSGCKVLKISQTETKPLFYQRMPVADSKESRIISASVLSRDIYNYNDSRRSVVRCVVCYQKLESRVFLHVHLTNHFWELFTDKNIRDLMALANLNGDIRIIVNKEDNFVGMAPDDPMVERRKAFLKKQAMLPDNGISSKNAVVPELWINETETEVYEHKDEKKKRPENDLSNLDIDEDQIPKKFDIYEIDEDLQYTNQLSLNRICIINKDKIYCMICRRSVEYSVRIVYEHFRSVEHSYFLMQMVQDHTKFKAFPDEFSDLNLARELMEDRNDRHIVCHVCDPANPIVVPNTNDALKNHINQYRHLKSKCELINNLRQFKTDFHSRLERSWSNTQRYWCVVCGEKFKYEKTFYTHLNTKNHNRKCERYAPYENFVCDFCPTCGLLFYGFKNTLTYHSSCKMHQYYADRTFYLITRLPSAVEDLLANAEKVVASKMEALDLENSLMEYEEKLLVGDLKNTLKNYVEAQIYSFGSRVSGLGSTTSDLDLFLDCDNLYHTGTIKTDTSRFLREVEHALKQHEDVWTIKRTILDCRVPIIKIVHQVTRVDCDLSFTNGLTVENSKLVKSYVDKFPLSRKLIYFIKDWINISNLGGEDGISSYAIAWMVIYYLQTKFILPNVATLIQIEGKSRLIGGWETGASTDFSIPNSDFNFKNLLRGFFIMCAGFDYRNNIICPLLGRPLKKLDIIKPEKLTDLPDEMILYKQYITKNKKAQRFSLDSVIAVQDPYDLSNNLTKAVKKNTMYRFKTFCSLSAEKLED